MTGIPQRENDGGIPEIIPETLAREPGRLVLVDVRSADEFRGQLGHIKGALPSPLGAELEALLAATDRTTPIVFVCRSGGRLEHRGGIHQQP